MIVKSVFNPVNVARYMWAELLFSSLFAILALFLNHNFPGRFDVPFSIVAILGSALAIFLAFRNNTSYNRWWEARTLWGGIINSSRVFARLVITFTDSHRSQANYNEARSAQFKTQLIHMQIAWCHALRIHLRGSQNWGSLGDYLNQADFQQIMLADNKPNQLQLVMGQKIYEAMANGTLAGFDSFQLEGQLLALANYQGGCERIKNTPLLRQYHFFTKLFLFAFMLLLPFALLKDFSALSRIWMVFPVSVLISFVFGVMGKVGEVNEDPFEGQITDVPLNSHCNTIERDLLQMLGKEPSAKKLVADNGILM